MVRKRKESNEPVMMSVFDEISVLMIQTDSTGTIISLYEEKGKNWNGLAASLRGKNLADIIDKTQIVNLREALTETIMEGQGQLEIKIGTDPEVNFSARFLKLNDNAITCLFSKPITAGQAASTSLTDWGYRDLVEKMSEVVYELDKEGTFKYISPSVERLLGFNQEEVIGKDVRLFVPEEEDVVKCRELYLIQKKEYSGDLYLKTRQGDYKWVRFSTNALFRDGKLTGSTGTIIDITEQKNYEIAIAASERQYRLLAENISDVIWLYNVTKERFIYMSPSVFQLRGISTEYAMQRRLDEGLEPESAEKVRKTITEALTDQDQNKSRNRTYLNELQIMTATGGLMWIETSTRYNINEDGDIVILGVTRNIEDRKKAEFELQKSADELKTSEEIFSTIFNESPVSMILSDPASKVILDVNRKLLATLGFKRDDIIGREFFSLGLDIHDSRAMELGRRLSNGIPVRDFEVRITTRKGDTFDFLLTVERIRLKKETRLLTTAIDITERKKGEKRISRMLDQEKLIADISQILNYPGDIREHLDRIVALVGLHTDVGRVFIHEEVAGGKLKIGAYAWCNEPAPSPGMEFTKLTEQNIDGWKKLIQEHGIIKADDITDLPENLISDLISQDVKSFLCYQLNSGDIALGYLGFLAYGKIRIWRPDEIDLLRIISGIISNAYQRKSIAEKMELSNLRLNLAIESANEGLWDVNFEENQVYTNDRCYRMLGYEKGEIDFDSSNLWNLIHPDDRKKVAEAFEKHFRGETDVYTSVYRLRAKDNTYKWILDHGQVVKKSPEGKPLRFLGTRLDINDQKEIELKLKQLVETQDKLFSIIAHDLRGPVGSFSQGIELLTSGRIKDENLRNRLLGDLRKTSQTTYRLLENLLNWSITKSNTISIEPEPLRLKQLIEENLKLLATYMLQKSIDVKVEADDQLMAYADRDSVNLVLRNLLNNAVKFTPNEGMVKISAHNSGPKVELQIDDTGVGMSREILENLFKINSYNSTLGTNKEKGAGIGLVLCKDIVERNGGSIWAESTPGSGSSFKFTLPRYE